MSNRLFLEQGGFALVIVMMTAALMAAMVSSLALVTVTETAVAANYRDASEALYAADAAVEFALQQIARVEDWSDLIGESGPTVLVDSPFQDLVPVVGPSKVHVVVWLADRSPEPRDEEAALRVLSVTGQALGARGSRRVVEVLVEKADSSAVRLLAWRELP